MLNRQELENVAVLSKLEIEEKDFDRLLGDMKAIVQFADKISSANFNMSGFFGFDDLHNDFRLDEIIDSNSQEEILKNCKTSEEGFFKLNLNGN